ncbi:PEP-CTERM sorting domain-containing protein [Methylotuvimicrobium sp. KM2]|uniref:PEP-CTERM sorting domain-containing protein n=1 Tax=Methylotuvimicrobium sp. KM2 TaxID=3133976 RepID=UPI003101AF74
MIGGNNVNNLSGFPATIDFTIIADATGMLSFDWSYETNDNSPAYDPLFFLHNGTEHGLSGNTGPKTQTGFFEFSVQIGDVFGFRQASVDSLFGSAQSTISNFSAPTPLPSLPIPEPGALAMLGIALAGFNFFRRHRNESK